MSIKGLFKSEKKYIFLLLGIITAITLVFYLPSIINNAPVTFGTDLKPQWYEFYTEFYNLLRNIIYNKSMPFYSWNLFLGNNFWASKGYYMVGDIYSYIGFLLNNNFFVMYMEITYLKLLVSGIGFYLLLSEIGHKPITKIICSLAYAFSGWAIFFSGQMVFLSFYSMVPFYIWGIERYIRHNKWFIFSLSCAFCFSCNYYLFYTISLLSPIYFTYRYFYLDKKGKDFILSALKLIGYYLLGSLVTAVFWLPSLLYVQSGSGRSMENVTKFFSPTTYLNFLYSFFSPNYLYLYRNNIFETSGAHYTREICCWSSTILLLFVPQYFKLADKKKKILTGLFYLLFAVIASFPILDSIMHGFSNPSFRWTFFIIVFNLLIVSDVIDNIDLLDKKLLGITSIIYSLIICALVIVGIKINNYSFSDYSKNILLSVIIIGIIVISYFVVSRKNIKTITIIVILELTVAGFYCFYSDTKDKKEETYDYMYMATHVLEYYDNQLNDYLLSLDSNNVNEFYRLNIDVYDMYWDFSHNMSLIYKIKGLSTYDSTYAPSFFSMYIMEPSVASFDAGWIFDIKDENLMRFLNTKYAVTYANQELNTDYWTLIDTDYLYGLYIWEANDYRSLGTTYSSIMTEDEYKEIRDTSLFLDKVIVDPTKTDFETIKSFLSNAKGELTDISYGNNRLTGTIKSDKDGFMVITIPYDEGWKITVDGIEQKYYEVSGGFIGLAINGGNHSLEMNFTPKGFWLGLSLSGASFISLIVVLIIDKKKQKTKLV